MSLLGKLLSGLLGIIGSLSQQQTNGNSQWGTLQAPSFPQFLTNNPMSAGFPWGTLTAANTNPYTFAPNTHVTRNYHFTITRGTIAPDGYQVAVLLVNGAFPGPAIEANWGDMIQITVDNQITGPPEGTTIHMHGFPQKGTNYADGVPAVSQCPIAPGSSFTYTFQATLYGTSWYHSHYSAQLAGGLAGPVIIHGPHEQAQYDIDLGPVFLQDWYHKPYLQIVEELLKPLSQGGNPRPVSDSNLINGKMNFDCSTLPPGDKTPCTSNAGISQFKFTAGKTHRLRLINAGSEAIQRFSIDGHSMTVIANDFVHVQPYSTKDVTLGIGQRTDVLVTANAGPPNSAFWMRSNISTACTGSNQPNAVAAIFYQYADIYKPPKSQAWDIPDPGTCANDDLALTVPVFPINAATPSSTQNLDINFYVNATGSFLWTLGGTSFRADYNNPALMQAQAGNLSFPAIANVQNLGSNSTVRIIVNNPTPASHPMHLHGHNMQVLSEGPGNWDGVSITNAQNPQRRDVQIVRPFGHFVCQFNLDNPGVWPFHCHIAWHVSAGLYATLLERPADIRMESNVQSILQQTCQGWTQFTDSNVPNQIDSGV